jgi:hypothetical protein
VTCLTWLLIYTMRRAAGSVIGLLWSKTVMTRDIHGR